VGKAGTLVLWGMSPVPVCAARSRNVGPKTHHLWNDFGRGNRQCKRRPYHSLDMEFSLPPCSVLQAHRNFSVQRMPIATVKQLCVPSAVVKSDSLVEQVAQIEDFASGKVDRRAFFQRNHFTAGLDLLVRRGLDRLAGKSEDGAFYLTHAMGGGKTHSLIAFGLLAADPALRREVAPKLAAGADFGAAEVVIFNGHQNPETLLWGYIAEKLGRGDVMAPFWRSGAKTPGVDEWVCRARRQAGADPARRAAELSPDGPGRARAGVAQGVG
jgi:hypothetical protein